VYTANRSTRRAFAIFQETICDGIAPTWRDENGFPIVYATEREAQVEIAEMVIEHLRQFIAGERDFDEVVTEGDFVLPVEVWPDGTIQTEDGLRFGKPEQ
jgi:hypothetical protein